MATWGIIRTDNTDERLVDGTVGVLVDWRDTHRAAVEAAHARRAAVPAGDFTVRKLAVVRDGEIVYP